MNNYRYQLLFILSLTCFSLIPDISDRSYLSVVSSSTNRQVLAAPNLHTNLVAQSNTYESLMEAGQSAFANQNYVEAWENYQRALQQRPNDSTAAQQVAEVEGYAYDQAMQAGYRATQAREYQTALQKFEQALLIRPDSFYAQQAINNVKQYISNQAVQADLTEAENGNGFNWLWLPAIAIAIVGIGVGLWLWQRKSQSRAEGEDSYLEPQPEPGVNLQPQPKTQQINHKITATGDHHSPSTTDSQSIYPVPTDNNSQSNLTTNSSLAKVDIVVELVEELNHLDAKVRRKAIWELAQRADSRALKPLVRLMIDADSQERSLILEAVSQIASRTLKPVNQALQISLEDENSQVRKNAIRDLTKVYELMSQVTKRLTHAVEDSDVEVRETARWALNQLNQMPNITELDTLIQYPSKGAKEKKPLDH